MSFVVVTKESGAREDFCLGKWKGTFDSHRVFSDASIPEEGMEYPELVFNSRSTGEAQKARREKLGDYTFVICFIAEMTFQDFLSFMNSLVRHEDWYQKVMKNCRHFVEGVQEMIQNETKWTVSAPTDEDTKVVLDFLRDR